MFKQKRKLVPPMKRSLDETAFQVFEIIDEEERPKYQKNRFVSPIFGENVKDEVVIPVMTGIKHDLDKLDSFRTRPKMNKEDRIRKYGTAYPEFDLIKGKNLQEVLDAQANGKLNARIIDTPASSTQSITPKEEPIVKPNQEQQSYREEAITQNKEHDDESPTVSEQHQSSNGHETPQETLQSSPYEEPVEVPEVKKNPVHVQDIPKNGFVKSNAKRSQNYQLPPFNLFSKPQAQRPDLSASIEKHIETLNQTFAEFQIGARVYKHTQGPTVTRYEIVLDSGVNVRKITNIEANLKMALAATHIRIEAPIPGKSTVGIEVPNEQAQTVHFVDIINTSMFKNAAQPLTVGLGLDIDGNPVYTSIKSMPHGLVAGATGSGKSVCINTLLMSLLIKYTPSELKLILIDPKMVELTSYNHIPHLITPVITDSKAATAALRWVVEEMDRRFNTFSEERVRDIDAYNQKTDDSDEKMPYIVIIVDELADLMMISSQHTEDAIKRLTQKARACGIHLIIATQRPSTDVIKGTIKANIPTRMAFSVSSHVDSQTIIDSSGADKLLGRGDMLFVTNGQHKIRVQGAFIADHDIEKVTNFIREQQKPDYLFDQDMLVKNIAKALDRDELFEDVARFVTFEQEASINKISKHFSIGFNRAQSIVEALEETGIVSENLGSRAREVLIKAEDIEVILSKLR